MRHYFSVNTHMNIQMEPQNQQVLVKYSLQNQSKVLFLKTIIYIFVQDCGGVCHWRTYISQIHRLQFSILHAWCSFRTGKGKVHGVPKHHIMVVFTVNTNVLMQSCITSKYYCVLRSYISSYCVKYSCQRKLREV